MNSRPRESDVGSRSKPAHEESRRVLPRRNLRRVVSAAKGYGGPRLSIEDLTQEDGIGQVKAVEKFDPDKRCRLSTYATWWVRQSEGREPTSKEDG